MDAKMPGNSPFDARVESIQCKGLCQKCCTILPFPKRLREAYPERKLPSRPFTVYLRWMLNPDHACPFLEQGKCSIYAVRPAICRLWGNTERMPCPHGCERDGPLLTYREGFRYLRAHGEGFY